MIWSADILVGFGDSPAPGRQECRRSNYRLPPEHRDAPPRMDPAKKQPPEHCRRLEPFAYEGQSETAYFLRRSQTIKPAKPMPQKAIVVGSGIGWMARSVK